MIRCTLIEGDLIHYEVEVHGDYQEGSRADAINPPEPAVFEIDSVFLRATVISGARIEHLPRPNIIGLLSEEQLDELEAEILTSIRTGI